MKFTNHFLLFFCILLFTCNSQTGETKTENGLTVFQHGVASGDPLSDRVIVWTKVSPSDSLSNVEVDWELASSEDFNSILKYGKYTTSSDRDYTVKIDLKGLNPDSRYFYRFKALGDTSIIGKTKTTPVNADSLQLAIVSCSNYEWGYFNVYGRIADRNDLDAVLHLGDYIYEYGVREYGANLGRVHEPSTEIITLDDYRTRYSLYRRDKDLMAAHANHPFIVIWDDHEIANNSYVSGAQNHQEDEGPYEARKAAARKAYYEWMPIREGEKLYRKFSFGDLAEVFMLDERLEGRTKQLESMDDPDYESEERSMLGEEQLDWLKANLTASESSWKIIGNQVIYSDLNRGLVFPDRPRNMDSWDGYPVEKKDIAKTILNNSIENVIWITGDTHSSWVFNTVVEGVSDQPIAVEFGATSITSSNYDERTAIDTVRMAEQLYLKGNPHLKYSNLADHGYVLLTLSANQAKAQYYFVDTVIEPSDKERLGYEGVVSNGNPTVETIR